MTFRLQSPYNTPPAIAECDGIRERARYEIVHRRIDDDHPRCIHCGVETGPSVPWVSDKERFMRHPARCS